MTTKIKYNSKTNYNYEYLLKNKNDFKKKSLEIDQQNEQKVVPQ